MATMQVDVVSAEERLFSGQAEAVFARSLDGDIAILPGHQPALLALEDAPVRVRTAEGDEVTVAVHHGFLEVREDQLTVLADIAELARDIDVERAKAARRRAEQHLADESYTGDAQGELERAQLRLRLAGADV